MLLLVAFLGVMRPWGPVDAPSRAVQGVSPVLAGAPEDPRREAEPGDAGSVRALSGGAPRADSYQSALRQASAASTVSATRDPALAADQWSFIGPVNIGGRITAVAVDRGHPGTIYISTASGGVWKTIDAGTTFTPAWPVDLVQAVGSLAMGSDGVLYAGTGEANPGGGSITFGGNGLYRSRDGGATWQNVGLATSGAIGRVAVAPSDPRVVYAAASGNLFVPGGERGVYVSTDGGDHWSQSLAGVNSTSGAIDLAIDPANPRRVFAAMWDHVRAPDLRTYGGVGSGVWRTTDGTHWTRLTVSSLAPARVGRISIAMSPTLTNLVYALVVTTDGGLDNFYTSVNGGDTFTAPALADPVLSTSMTSYGWWFGTLAVDPLQPTRLLAGGLLLVQSVTGGASWVLGDPTVHADQHAIVFDPTTTGRVYVGGDGGLSTSTNDGVTFMHSSDQPFTQFDSVDVSQRDATRVVGGAQDNGSLRSYGGSGWNSYGGGDGQKSLINPVNQDIVYGCSQYGACAVSTDGGATSSSLGSTVSTRHSWLTPLEFDPRNPSIVYYAGNRLNRSMDDGKTFSVISPDLTGGAGHDPIYTNFGTITTLAAAPIADGFIIVGTDDGRIQTTVDGGKNWVLSTDPHLPRTWVTRVAIDRTDPRVVYATFSGYRGGSPLAHVVRSGDRGKTWSDISGDLPSAPVNKILSLPGGLVVAGDVGVYLSRDNGASWLRVGSGLPQAPVEDLAYQAATQTLVAASYGRGVWKISLPASLTFPGPPATPAPAAPDHVGLPNTAIGGAPWVPAAAMLLLVIGLLRRRLRSA